MLNKGQGGIGCCEVRRWLDGGRVLVTDVKGKELFRMFVSIHESWHI